MMITQKSLFLGCALALSAASLYAQDQPNKKTPESSEI